MEKCRFKKIEFRGPEQLFPEGLGEILEGYWQREMGRLVYPVPELAEVVEDLKIGLRFMKG